MTHQYSRIILNRGLVEESTSTGLGVCGSNEAKKTDCIDSKKMVKNFCASQKYHKIDFFLTFICNQSIHFGVKEIKIGLIVICGNNISMTLEPCRWLKNTKLRHH